MEKQEETKTSSYWIVLLFRIYSIMNGVLKLNTERVTKENIYSLIELIKNAIEVHTCIIEQSANESTFCY